jgi:hypothetical protein
MTVFFEILKIIVPAVVVALTAYFIIREMLRKQLQMQDQRIRQERQSSVTPLRMQAYERISILIERLSLPGMLMRTDSSGMQANTLKIALMMNVQQEFEHNISQQIYVSEKLWEIIKATRDDLIQFLGAVSEKLPKGATAQVYRETLLAYHQQREYDPVATAQMAIRKEATSLF